MKGKHKVLVVDDSVAVRRAVCLMLQGGNFTCQEAADGQAALDILQAHDMDLVLADLNMPRMTGQELIKAMRASGKLKFLPVLVLTTECSDDVVSELKRNGVTGVLQKPIDRDALLNAINRCLA